MNKGDKIQKKDKSSLSYVITVELDEYGDGCLWAERYRLPRIVQLYGICTDYPILIKEKDVNEWGVVN